MTLEELKQTPEYKDEAVYTMDEIYSIIRSAYDAGIPMCAFGTMSPDWKDEISERQVNLLRADGYIVEWNCYRYEVSGW